MYVYFHGLLCQCRVTLSLFARPSINVSLGSYDRAQMNTQFLANANYKHINSASRGGFVVSTDSTLVNYDWQLIFQG